MTTSTPTSALRSPRETLEPFFGELARHRRLTPAEEILLGQRIQLGRRAAATLAACDVLTDDQRRRLQARIRAAEEATERFVLANLRLVVYLATRHRGHHQTLADAVADGNVGLLQAVEHFDWRLGYRFSTYATWIIRQAISRGRAATRRAVTVSATTDAQIGRVCRAGAELHERLGREPTIAELASRTGFRPSTVVHYLALAAPTVSLDAPTGTDQHHSAADDLAAPETSDGQATPTGDVHQLLDRLPVHERRLLELRFGLDGRGSRTHAEIARELGTTVARVRQVEARALQRLRRTSAARNAYDLLVG